MTDHAKAAAHYTDLLDAINNPIAHRVTIEAFALDPGTDLSVCTFGRMDRDDCWERVVLAPNPGRKARVVGLWRIVPEPADG